MVIIGEPETNSLAVVSGFISTGELLVIIHVCLLPAQITTTLLHVFNDLGLSLFLVRLFFKRAS